MAPKKMARKRCAGRQSPRKAPAEAVAEQPVMAEAEFAQRPVCDVAVATDAGAGAVDAVAPRRAPGPGGCVPMKTFAYAPQRSRMAKMARMEMAEAMPVLCRTLVARASGGDMTAMRLIWQMAMFDERRKGSAAARRAARRQNDAWAKKEWKELTAGLDEAASTDGDGAVQG